MSGHIREVCEHGQVISQCRCPGPRTDRVVRPCPFPEHAKAELAAEEQRHLDTLGYLAAANRYARDPEFHARAVRVEQLIAAAEPRLVEEARFGLRWGAAVTLHLVDTGIESPHPLPGQPDATVYGCPFTECGWTLEVPNAIDWAARDGIALSPRVLTRLHGAAIERDLRKHLLGEHRDAIEALAGLL